jgi:transposase
VGLPGLRVVAVARDSCDVLTVTVESPPAVMGCRACGVIAHAHGRVDVRLVDAPAFGRPVRIVWRKRRWVCPDVGCPVWTFVEQDERVSAPRGKLTVRAARWAIEQIRGEHASVNGVRRQLGCGWRTVWDAVRQLLEVADEDPSRFEGVTRLGVDEHIWHHVSTKPAQDGGRGPKELTGMVDLSLHANDRGELVVKARLLDLVPGRSGQTYKTWLHDRGEAFRSQVEVATLDPFHGYKNAIDDQLEDARSVLDAFHVVKLATKVVDDVRRRVQQQIHGHRGRKNDPLYRVRNILRAGRENLTERQHARLEAVWAADERHVEVEVAWMCAQQVRDAYHQPTHAAGRAIAQKVLTSFASCPIPEVKRLGKTLTTWRSEFLGYFDTGGANNGGTEASPAASATETTTASACSSSPAA